MSCHAMQYVVTMLPVSPNVQALNSSGISQFALIFTFYSLSLNLRGERRATRPLVRPSGMALCRSTAADVVARGWLTNLTPSSKSFVAVLLDGCDNHLRCACRYMSTHEPNQRRRSDFMYRRNVSLRANEFRQSLQWCGRALRWT